jgi:phospholipid/cholesterol/gamma-HCH transport system ATP-binding protein
MMNPELPENTGAAMEPAARSKSPDSEIIRVQNLTAAYGRRTILRDLNFSVHRGETFVILGGSGCGKSTLLKHLIGLYEPAAGSIEIDGMQLVGADESTRRQILRRLGVMYQSGALFGSLTLTENVALPLEEFTKIPREGIEVIAWSKLQLVGLGDSLHHLPSEVSGGMQKRAAIARAMALDPAVLFLDEPSAGLDPVTSAELDALIRRLQKALGLTFVIVTHELPSIYEVADRVIMLDGKSQSIIAEGRPADLRDHSEIAEVRQFFRREANS